MSNQAEQRATSWLSQGFECLAGRIAEQDRNASRPELDFDIVIVGSGYGGAVAAHGLARAGGPSVCVLERGKEYLPGAFPARLSDLPGHTRLSSTRKDAPRGEHEGLFDIKIGSDVSAVVASGLGGGSLINAGVMIAPEGAALTALEQAVGEPLGAYYDQALTLLGARDNTIREHQGGAVPLKFTALSALSDRLAPLQARFRATPITVAMQDKVNDAGIALTACRLCGDCATGCNYNAKESLDTNLLVQAARQGAHIFTSASVLRIERDDVRDAWCLSVQHTDPAMHARLGPVTRLLCGKLVLAAGTYGSTEILLRSRTPGLPFSPMLGRKFSSNGDMIAVAYGQQEEVNAIADEAIPSAKRGVGPTITGMISMPATAEGGALTIQELAVPAPLRRLFEEVVTTANTLNELAGADLDVHTRDGQDPCAVDAHRLRHSAVLAVFGDDGARGVMQLSGDADDAGVSVVWPGLGEHPLFERQVDLLEAGARRGGRAANGTILPNPAWKILPDSMAYLLKNKHGPLLTVHPLGGCPIGASAVSGVVNSLGQVYQGGASDAGEVHSSLVVLDGAIVPQALGVNPALTITALAVRAVKQLQELWAPADEAAPAAPATASETTFAQRPVFRHLSEVPPARAPTEVQFVERMTGPVTLRGKDGAPQDCYVELTLRFTAVDLAALILPQAGAPVPLRRQLVANDKSTLDIYDATDWTTWRRERDGKAADERPRPLLHAPLSGTLDFLHREPSIGLQRVGRAFFPWLRNRGLRDTWQWLAKSYEDGTLFERGEGEDTLFGRLSGALALASRGGEVRRFDYVLNVGAITAPDSTPWQRAFAGAAIKGEKRFTYTTAANPWSQLMQMTLTVFPGMIVDQAPPVLELDTEFLVRENVALMRVVTQQDQPAALSDVAGLGAYLLRLLLNVHIWSFRNPDTGPARRPQRLPGTLPGIEAPEIKELEVGHLPDGNPVYARLTRYGRANMPGKAPPIVMIHGYSASGTTFAHHLVNPNLTSHMVALGRDVWILDMRTSSGMPTATHPWSFEDAALADIPAAIDWVCQRTGYPQVDVVAHCMGGAMFGMAILGDPDQDAPFAAQQQALGPRVRRLVLSQVGPLVVFTQANIFRAYLMSYMRTLLPHLDFPFMLEGEPTLTDELVDRALATLPYPRREFELENPLWPWQRADFVRTRHRMDALYGRDFELPNVDQPVLEHIDDFFGPYNLETLGQAIHFARLKTITNQDGRNPYVSSAKLRARWTFPTLSIHGTNNGLSDVATLSRMQTILDRAQCPFTPMPFEGFGHQDCWIGRDAVQVFEAVAKFLAPPTEEAPAPVHRDAVAAAMAPSLAQSAKKPADSQDSAPAPKLFACIPWAGPVLSGLDMAGSEGHGAPTHVSAAIGPVLYSAKYIVFVPVTEQEGHFAIWSAAPDATPRDSLVAGATLYRHDGDDPDKDGWIRLAAPPTPAGAAGMLMLTVHDESEALDKLEFDFRWFSHILPIKMGNINWLSEFTRDFGGLGLREEWEEVKKWFDPQIDPICEAIVAQLRKNTANALRNGLIATGSALPATSAPAAKAPAADARTVMASAAAPVSAPPAAALHFAVASCQYPAGVLDQEPAFASYARLAAVLDGTRKGPKPAFLLLLGDQIYADATAGLFDPTLLGERYLRPYEALFGNAHVKSVLRRLPAFMMLDDHEIADNWEPGPDPDQADPDRDAGVASYLKYQRPGQQQPPTDPATKRPQLWFDFEAHGIPFFATDTRTDREPRTAATVGQAGILGRAQFRALLRWLLLQQRIRAPGTPIIITSAAMIAPSRLGPLQGRDPAQLLRADGWDGYPASRQRLLAFIARRRIENVVFLSGDEHISCAATLELTAPGRAPVTVRSFHSSALYSPYPFANSREEDMYSSPHVTRFNYPPRSKRVYECVVDATFTPGDGFAVISLVPETANGPASVTWQLAHRFDRAD